MRFKPPFCRRLEGKEFCAFQRGTPSLAGRPLFQNSPPDCFEIHPCGAHDVGGFRSLRRATRAPPSTRKPFLGKGLTPNLFNMHDLAHYPCIAVGDILLEKSFSSNSPLELLHIFGDREAWLPIAENL